MIEDILPFAQLTATGALVAVLVYLIRTLASGAWIPKVTVDILLAARDAEIVRANLRADEWHSAFEGERHVSELVREQNRELIEVAKTAGHVMEALEIVVEGRSRVVPPSA